MTKLKFNANEMLERAKLKTIFGGEYSELDGCPEGEPFGCVCNDSPTTLNCKTTCDSCEATCDGAGGVKSCTEV